MRTTTTREYDAEGRLIREVTVTEHDDKQTNPGLFRTADCTCAAWFGVVPSPPCPVHGQSQFVRIICTANTDAVSGALEKALRKAEWRAA